MPRKQLLVVGFRHWGQVAKQVQQQKAARIAVLNAKKFHTAGAHKAAAHKGASGPQQSASQLHKGPAARHDGPQAPSFAAAPLLGRQSAGASPGILGRLFNRFRRAPSAHTSKALPSAPSFAAAPILRGNQRGPPQPAQRNAVLSAAERLAAQATAKAPVVSPATAANPLYRLARLGGAGGGSNSTAAGSGARHGPAAGGKENLGAALKQYAELPQKQAQQAPAAAGGTAKKAAQRALDAKALLRYAKLK